MMRKALLLTAALGFVASSAFGAKLKVLPPNIPAVPIIDTPVTESGYVLKSSNQHPPVISETPGEIVGYTFHDQQHNCAMGKQIAVNSFGGVHLVWTHAPNAAVDPRRIYYNYRVPDVEYPATNPEDAWIHGEGTIVDDNLQRTGYARLDLSNSDRSIVVYHRNHGSGRTDTQVAVEMDPAGDPSIVGSGVFDRSWVDIASYPSRTLIWPGVTIDGDESVYAISQDNDDATPSPGNTVYYGKSTAAIPVSGTMSYTPWETIAPSASRMRSLSYLIDASETSNKVARIVMAGFNDEPSYDGAGGIWQRENNVILEISSDGGATWEEINITNYEDPEQARVSNWFRDGDHPGFVGDDGLGLDHWYFRAAYTFDVHIDNEDRVHVVWTTCMFKIPDFSVTNPADAVTGLIDTGALFHWDDESRTTHVIVDDLMNDINFSEDAGDLGAFKTTISNPTIGSDESGNLFVTYSSFSAEDLGGADAEFRPNGDVYVVGSMDHGATWSSAVNVTNSATPDCEPGDCDSEVWVSMAEKVDNYIHIMYVNDKEPGRYTGPGSESDAFNCPVMYHRVPVDILAIEDNNDNTVAGARPRLERNYPNPFQTATTIRFSLDKSDRVSLKVYDVDGRLVKTVVDNQAMDSGRHEVNFRADNLPSGVYFYQLQTSGRSDTKRMLMLK